MENNPALPATPPSARAVGSCTSPRATIVSVSVERSLNELIERLVRDTLDDEAHHIEPEVRILVFRTGRVDEARREHRLPR